MNIRKMAIITAIREAERTMGEDSEFTCSKAIDLLGVDQDSEEATEVLVVYSELQSISHHLPFAAQ